jgi:hypothetical protein
MKKQIFTIALVSCSLVYFISCSDKDDTAAGTCSDGIKNQTETGVDCGGPCGACPTCTDGIKNGTETGVDCGGSCAACASCSDNIQNQGETGIDCGGPCPPCSTPSCSDGILNNGETQIDCGGPNCSACPTATMTSLVDGVAWTSNVTGFPKITHAGGIFLLNGTQLSPNGVISITLPSTAGSTGPFPLTSTTCYYTNGTNTYPGVSGTLNISSWNTTTHRVTGQFNFTATLGSVTHTITGGNFTNVYYTN